MLRTDGTATAIQRILEDVHAEFQQLGAGQPANYIPELAKANPDAFGIVIATTDGRLYAIGDAEQSFTIQSISKPFTYALALKLLSAEHMQRKVGVEPSGDAFNAISLHPDTGIPRNPMINAGAIATTAQIVAHDPERAESLLLTFYSELAGRRLGVEEAVFRSERETGHRNRAIGHLLRNFNIITSAPEPSLELYFRQCAVAVTCRDLAVMAATLACQGRNPFTGRVVLDPGITTNVLSVMGSCGMYDYTGQWLHDVGMPSKSGVGGGVLAVVPGRLGLAVYSPPLDRYGSSCRGIAVCEAISRRLQLHLFNQPPRAGTTIRSSASGSQRHSRRWRSAADCRLLDAHGRRIQVLQAQGVLDFAAVEELLAQLEACATDHCLLVLDLAQVLAMPPISAQLLQEQLDLLCAAGVRCLLCHGEHLEAFWQERQSRQQLNPGNTDLFRSLDDALEHAEDLLLEDLQRASATTSSTASSTTAATATVTATEVCPLSLLDLLPPATREVLRPLLERRVFDAGAPVCRRGEPGNELFLIESGRFSAVITPPPPQARIRLATFSPGVCFGEMAFLGGTSRIADVTAEIAGSCLVLTRLVFEQLQAERPQVVIDLLRALHQDLARKLERTDQQLSLLEPR